MENFLRPVSDTDVVAYPVGALIQAPRPAEASGYLILEGTVRLERGDDQPRLLSAGGTLMEAGAGWRAVAVTDCRLARLNTLSGAQRDFPLPPAGAEGDPQRWALHW